MIPQLAAAEEMSDELRACADDIEISRRLPDAWSRRFAEAGFYRLCVPEKYGGLEAPPVETMQVIETLARADGSAAWVVFIGATSGSVLAYLPEASSREIFSDPTVMLAGVFAPRGKAVAQSGGFQVNGRWQWGSGTQNADWVMGGCQVIRDGTAETMPNGAPRSRMMLAPQREIEFFDTWHVSGLCGTGSTDFAMNDLIVPESRALGLAGGRPLETPLYAFPQFGLLAMGIAAVTLGLARAAIDELVSFATEKTPSGSARPLANRASTQSDVSRAEAMLQSSRGFFYDSVARAYEAAKGEGSLSAEMRRDIRLATTHAVRESAKAVDLMYDLGGGTSVFRTSPLQRIFRDVHTATQHMMVAPSILELTGRLFLGLETDTSLL
jgi:alkylation response protein AidB-like acyl-CoA dehydrogenase